MICKTCENQDIGQQDNYCKICGTKIDKEVVKYFETIVTEKGNIVGHVCKCGLRHEWPGYVFAHYSDPLNHQCKCGIVTVICNGKVEARA